MSNYELNTLRREIKYYIDVETASRIKSDLEKVMLYDDHSGDKGYEINSLYFDSINNIDFSTKLSGTDVRKKIRLRTYGASDIYKLEIKQKKGELQQKESVILNNIEAEEIVKQRYEVLLNLFEKSESSKKIYKTMILGCYKPVAMVQYHRLAFVNPFCDTRVTFDYNIKSSEVDFSINNNQNLIPIMDNSIVLEIKYSGKLLGYISEILAKYNLTQISYSKYCSGRKLYYDFNY